MDWNQLTSHNEISEELDCIDSVIQSWNTDHILALSEIVDRIREKVSGIQNISPEIIQRISDTITLIEWFLPLWKEEIELPFLTIKWKTRDIDILPVKEALIIYVGEEDPLIIPCSKAQSGIIQKLIEYPDGLPIKEKNKTQLLKESSTLNALLNTYGVFFGIKEGVFIFDDKIIPEQWPLKKISLEAENTSELLTTNILRFWTNGEVSIKLEIFTPFKETHWLKIKVNIWNKTVNFSKYELEFFIKMLESLMMQ